MLRAAVWPWLRALAQCSTRIRFWYIVFHVAATSPAAKTSGALVRRNSSTTMPFSTVSPASLASSSRDWFFISLLTATGLTASRSRARGTDPERVHQQHLPVTVHRATPAAPIGRAPVLVG